MCRRPVVALWPSDPWTARSPPRPLWADWRQSASRCHSSPRVTTVPRLGQAPGWLSQPGQASGKIDNGNDTAWAPFSLHTDKGKPEIRPYLFAVDGKTPPKKRNRRGQVEETCNPSGDSSENIMSDVCRYSRQRLHSHAVRDAGEHTALFPSDKNFFHCDAFVIKSRLSAHVRNTKSPSSLGFFGRWLP